MCRRFPRTGRFAAIEQRDLSLDCVGHFGKGRRSIGSREFDSIVFGRIVGGGNVDGAVRTFVYHCVGNRRGRRSLRDQQWRDAMSRKDLGGQGAEGFSQETGIAPNDDPRAARLLRGHVPGDPMNGSPYIGKSKLICHDCAPPGGSELYLCCHDGLPTHSSRVC